MAAVGLGAALIVIGIVWAAFITTRRGALSDPRPPDGGAAPETLEPKGKGRRLSLGAELPAYGLVILGVVILLAGSLR